MGYQDNFLRELVAVEPLARVLYKVYLGQAEKELAEEGKDE